LILDQLILSRALIEIENIYNESMYGDKDIFRIKDLIHSVTETQWQSKRWLADTFHNLYRYQSGKILIIGGWYGLAAHELRKKFPDSSMNITSVDMDPKCEEMGYKLFGDRDIQFETWDATKPDIDYSQYSAIISTSCEHIDPEDLGNIISKKSKEAWVVLQSNDYFDHPSHINCYETVFEFQKSIMPYLQYKSINFSGALKLDNNSFKRFMVIGK
jgi:hypothetical protein